MKTDLLLGLLFSITFLGCKISNKHINAKIGGSLSGCENYYMESNKIDSIAHYLFSVDMKNIDRDTCMDHYYKCKKSSEEEEDTVWLSLSFYKGRNLEFIAETDWIDTNRISRVTFFSNNLKLKNGLAAGAAFNNVANEIDTLTRKNCPDGSLEFYLKGDTNTVFTFDVTENRKLFYGYNAINEIPDTLKVESIVVLRGENN